MELTSIEKVNVDLEMGSVIITGYDISEVISEIGAKTLLEHMDYADVMEFVAEAEEEKRELELLRAERS